MPEVAGMPNLLTLQQDVVICSVPAGDLCSQFNVPTLKKKKSSYVLSHEFLSATFIAILHICVLRSWGYVLRVIDHLVPVYFFASRSAKA